jgi:WD40 repeat protein
MNLIKRLEINGHIGAIYSSAYYKDFQLFTASGDKFVASWNLKTGLQEKFTIKCDQSVYKVSIQ